MVLPLQVLARVVLLGVGQRAQSGGRERRVVLLRGRREAGLQAAIERERDGLFRLLLPGWGDREHHGVRLLAPGGSHVVRGARPPRHHRSRVRVPRVGRRVGVLQVRAAIFAREARQVERSRGHGVRRPDARLLRLGPRAPLRLLRLLQPQRRGFRVALVGRGAGARRGRPQAVPSPPRPALRTPRFHPGAGRPRGGARVAPRAHRPHPQLPAHRVVPLRVPRRPSRGPPRPDRAADHRPSGERVSGSGAGPRVAPVPSHRGRDPHVEREEVLGTSSVRDTVGRRYIDREQIVAPRLQAQHKHVHVGRCR